VAWQLALIDLESLAINMAVNTIVKLLARRERPMGRYCRDEMGYAAGDPGGCAQPAADGFYSAHTSAAFTAASLVCLQHGALGLYGSVWADATACASALGVATATGVLRIVSDQNYLSDVLVGMGMGLVTGLLLPWLLHFRGGARPEPRGAPSIPPVAFAPMVSDQVLGMTAAGFW
jgi:membrane-associated phospholipid phosphatase